MAGYVSILASRKNGTLYTGVTNDLVRRVYEHKTKAVDGFSKKYSVNRLVYFERHETMPLAIQREKNIKHWSRKWKLALIEKDNPHWNDLYDQIIWWVIGLPVLPGSSPAMTIGGASSRNTFSSCPDLIRASRKPVIGNDRNPRGRHHAMCGIEAYANILLWMFLAGSVCMAVLARKLNDHLLVAPPPPKHLLFRKKNHIRPSYLLKPDLHFDAAGQPWAWRFTLVTAVTLATGALALYAMTVCR